MNQTLLKADIYKSSNRDVPKLVVALEFGRYSSGYAFQFRSEYDNDRTNINICTFRGTEGLRTYKTTTCILLKPDKSLDSFGYEAQRNYANLREEVGVDHDKWFFFDFFKIMLYRKEDLSEKTTLESASGTSLPAILVFARAIEYMKNHFITRFSHCVTPYLENMAKWVLTVPDIWNDQAKQFMKKAAEKAGIPSDTLMLSTEAEAAIFYCSEISGSQFKMHENNERLQGVAAPGSTAMVVDLGGSTVDITTVKIGMDGSLKQVFKSNSYDYGGMKVNEKFISLMNDITGVDIWKEFAAEETQDEHELCKEFELRKRDFSVGNDSKRKVHIRLPSTLKNIWERRSNRLVNENLSQLTGRLRGRVHYASGRLLFEEGLITELFEDTISEILNRVIESSTRAPIDAVILIGGFAQSDLVANQMRASLKELLIKVVRPSNPELAVLSGAVLIGHSSNIIGMTAELVSEKHDKHYKLEAPAGNLYVGNAFVERVQEVEVKKQTKAVDYCMDEKGQMSAQMNKNRRESIGNPTKQDQLNEELTLKLTQPQNDKDLLTKENIKLKSELSESQQQLKNAHNELENTQHELHKTRKGTQCAVSPALSQNKNKMLLPSHWASMKVTDIIQVPLDPEDREAAIRDEFSMVKTKFHETMPCARIISIKRVQNAVLWQFYDICKMAMENRLGREKQPIEMYLYHGTKPDVVDLICTSNFDNRMAGECMGAEYGQGAYFASSAKYSDNYANPDGKNHKFMFFAKVLVGKTCLGERNFKKPKYLDDEDKKKGTYDTCVNNIHHPTVYIVFDKNQCYPEYLIEYDI